MDTSHLLKVALAQLAPVWLDKARTLDRVCEAVKNAGLQGCELIVFGETFLPGYPFWLSITSGSEFDSQVQKEVHAHYLRNAVQIERGDLDRVCELAKKHGIAVYLGVAERPLDRGGHSIYCSLVYIDRQGQIGSVHRKLQPTYEERLTWAPGDGYGLRVHDLKQFTLGGLNCWENWMPLSRTALYGMGENLHVAVWPGNQRNTIDLTRFIAVESRSFVLSVSGLMRRSDFPPNTPHLGTILKDAPDVLADGGSCIAGPNGEWVMKPVVGKEGLLIAELDFNQVLEARHNFDVAGHYARPDVTRLMVNRDRQSLVGLDGEG